MARPMSWLWTRHNEAGATAVEYALMSSLIALVIIGAVTAFGQSVLGLFEAAAAQI